MDVVAGSFIWDDKKDAENYLRHHIDFAAATKAFADPKRKVFADSRHSGKEERLFCIGSVNNKVLTVRFTYRGSKIRIIGAGFWRKGRRHYEKEDT